MPQGYDISLSLSMASMSFFTGQVASVSKHSLSLRLHPTGGHIAMAKSRITADGSYTEV